MALNDIWVNMLAQSSDDGDFTRQVAFHEAFVVFEFTDVFAGELCSFAGLFVPVCYLINIAEGATSNLRVKSEISTYEVVHSAC